MVTTWHLSYKSSRWCYRLQLSQMSDVKATLLLLLTSSTEKQDTTWGREGILRVSIANTVFLLKLSSSLSSLLPTDFIHIKHRRYDPGNSS